MDNEPGGHRIQRIPPTERKGRVHTSTVTVAVIDVEGTVSKNSGFFKLDDKDFKIEWYSGTGKGGQNRNKVKACCRLTHLPTGIVKTAQCRTRQNSYAEAYSAMLQVLKTMQIGSNNQQIAYERKQQVGSGMRGDKIRTYRMQDNIVKDHLTGKSAACDKVLSGKFELLWN